MKSVYIHFPIFLLCLVFAGQYNEISAQSDVWDQWDREVVRKANTGQHADYLTEEEKKLILFMNLARLDGQRFASTFLDAFMDESGTDKTAYVRSLYRDLKDVSDLPLLLPEEDLTSIAQGHAEKSGKTGHVGHRDFKERFAPFMGNPYTHVGENCSYGYNRAIDIVITLLIDEGVSNLGHRKNILNESFNSVGVAIRPHKKYRVNCVIDYGQQLRSTLNDIPFE